MSAETRTPTDDADDTLCGLAVYSVELIPLGRISDVPPHTEPMSDTISGRRVRVAPIPTVRHILEGDDIVISESMIYSVEPDQDRVILNVPVRRLLQASSGMSSGSA